MRALQVLTLFKAMAIFEEDTTIEFAILSILQQSLSTSTDTNFSRVTLRGWVNVLLERSLLEGSAKEGIRIHDIVRSVLAQ